MERLKNLLGSDKNVGLHQYVNSILKGKELKRILEISIPLFFLSFSWAMVASVFSIKVNQITGDVFLSGIVFSIFFFVSIVMNLLLGILEDKIIVSKFIKIALFLHVPLPFLYLSARNFYHLILVRIYQAVISSLFWCSTWTYLRKVVRKAHAGERIGILYVFSDLAYLLALLIGGYLGNVNIDLPFYFFSIFAACSFVVSLKIEKVGKEEKLEFVRTAKLDFREFRRRFKFSLLFILVTLVICSASSLYSNFIPIILYNHGFTPLTISFVLLVQTIPTIILEIPMGIYIDRFGWRKATLIGSSIVASAALLLSLTLELIPVLIASFFYNLGLVFSSLVINYVFTSSFPKGRIGFFTGVLESVKHVGFGIGALISGFLLKEVRFSKTFAIFSILLCLVALACIFGEEKKIKKSP